MGKFILLIFFSSAVFFVSAQKPSSQIEIKPYFRWDKYPEFTYAINPVSDNKVNINSAGWGINLAYKYPVYNKFYISAGLGYYKYSFNDISNFNSTFGQSNGRTIKSPSYVYNRFLYATNRYWYNTIALNAGIEKHIDIGKNTAIVPGLGMTQYVTFSQRYNLGPSGIYKKNNLRYFGFSTNLYVSLQKKFGPFSLGPSIGVPLYDKWRQDHAFPGEEDSESRNKWLSGFGVGISLNIGIPEK